MSDFRVPIVRVNGITKHPNADALSIVQVDGENVIIRTGDFSEGDLAVYVPLDAVVPTTVPGTEFLGERPKDRRIRAKRLRGIYSEGLLLPMTALPQKTITDSFGSVTAPEWLCGPGDNVADYLGIKKHEDQVPDSWGTSVSGASVPGKRGLLGRFFHWCFADQLRSVEKDPGCIPFYDIEAFKKYKRIFDEGERVIITEKLHGTNWRACYLDKLYVGSRNNFWRDLANRKVPFREHLGEFVRVSILRRPRRDKDWSKSNLYWHVAHQYGIEEKLARYPRLAFYGEVYGQVQDLKYDAAPGQVWLRIFDIFDTEAQEWLPWDEAVSLCGWLGLDMVPVLYDGPFSEAVVEGLVEGQSAIASHFREGVVVKPADSREDQHFGRVILKAVSQQYKLRRGGSELH